MNEKTPRWLIFLLLACGLDMLLCAISLVCALVNHG